MSSQIEDYIGCQYTFDDGRSIKIIDINLRDTGEVEYYVNYEVKYAKTAIPKRILMVEKEFISNFSHLFFSTEFKKPDL
jgi:hypothetical protein